MCACDQLSDVRAVLESLSFCTHLEPATLVHPPFGDSMTCERWDRVYEQLAKEAIKFYLTALGHPDHESARALVGDEAFDRDSTDPLVCARLFLHALGGCDAIAEGQHEQLQVCPPCKLLNHCFMLTSVARRRCFLYTSGPTIADITRRSLTSPTRPSSPRR